MKAGEHMATGLFQQGMKLLMSPNVHISVICELTCVILWQRDRAI